MPTIVGKRGVGFAMTLTSFVALGAGGLFTLVEPESGTFGDAIWWSFVTITTVSLATLSHDDIRKGRRSRRDAGWDRVVAILTAAIAAHFVESQEADLASEIQRLHDRLERIEQAIDVEKSKE